MDESWRVGIVMPNTALSQLNISFDGALASKESTHGHVATPSLVAERLFGLGMDAPPQYSQLVYPTVLSAALLLLRLPAQRARDRAHACRTGDEYVLVSHSSPARPARARVSEG